MKLIDFLEPLTCNSKLTEEYAYNNFGDFVVIDGSTMNDYKLKIKTFDYDGISICVTTAGIYAGNVSIFKGKFSVGNNVKCYFLRKKFKKINLDYLVVHLSLIAEKCLTGKSGDYSSLNISMFENYEFNFADLNFQKKAALFYLKYKEIEKKCNFIESILLEQDYNLNISNYKCIAQVPATDIFKLKGGYSKLTEEFRYNNSDNQLIPVYTGAKKFENLYVNKDVIPKEYLFKNYNMKVTRKGDAGHVMLISDKIFTINDDAYAIKNLTNDNIIYNEMIYLWLFRKYAVKSVVDENGNGTFSKTSFENRIIKIPDKKTQEIIIKYMFIYEELNKLVSLTKNELYDIKLSMRNLDFDNN